jgi:prolyl-tRNA editing enzyme YbaK/EbsC (Cys-tRNA(Pro) deacylase)
VAIDDLISVLDRAGVSYELLEHEHTESGIAEGQALGVALDEVAKTLILDTPSGHVRALIPAEAGIDMRKAAELLGRADVDCAVGFAPCLTAVDDMGYQVDEAEVICWGRCRRVSLQLLSRPTAERAV